MHEIPTTTPDIAAALKSHDENRQGEAYAPFALDPNQYKKHFYIESYGCQMNFSDSEIVASIMADNNYVATTELSEADVVFINTCSIREKAQEKVFHQLGQIGIASAPVGIG